VRSTSQSLREVVVPLSDAAPKMKTARLVSLCEIEVGLLLQETFAAEAPAEDAWTLFSGYPFARAWRAVDAVGERTLRTARHTVWTWGRRRAWTEALQDYQLLDRQLRGYEVADLSLPAVRRRSLSVAPDRWDAYERLLREAPAFAGRPMVIAAAGTPSRSDGIRPPFSCPSQPFPHRSNMISRHCRRTAVSHCPSCGATCWRQRRSWIP
jgi:hypothetical protein